MEQLVEKALRHAHYGYLFETGRVAAEALPTNWARATCCTACSWADMRNPRNRTMSESPRWTHRRRAQGTGATSAPTTQNGRLNYE